jgi:hypothetical protein
MISILDAFAEGRREVHGPDADGITTIIEYRYNTELKRREKALGERIFAFSSAALLMLPGRSTV